MNIKTWMLQTLSFISFFLFTLLFSPQLLAEKIELVADLNKFSIEGWAGKNITVYQNKVYFTADDSVIGDELYVHDPATNQTTLVKDINIGESGSDSHDFIIYEEILYFFAFDGEAYNLYSFTSESNGLTKVQSLDYTKVGVFDTVPHALTVYRGKLYFLHQNFFSNILMAYDPKSSLVTTISGAYGDTDRFSYNQFRGMVVVSDKLYFIIANDGPYNEMLFFDEDIGKVQRLNSIEGVSRVDYPDNMNEFDGQLVFLDHNELYAFQPQTNELILLFSLPSYIDNLFIDKNSNKFYFSSKDEKYGEELFEYDVTTKQVRLVADINKGANDSSPKSLTAYGNSLYFTAMSEIYGRELYVYNTVSDVVALASDVLNGKASSDPQYLTKHLDNLYFQVSRKGGYLAKFNIVSGEINTLLSFDGKNTSGSNPEYFVEYRNKLYFSALENDFEGKKIFSLDKDTSVVKKVSEHTMYSQGIVYQDKLYFRSYEHPYGYELFSYDDQTELTTLVVDIGPEGVLNYDSSRPEVVFNNKLYFTASNRREGENNIRKKIICL